MLTLRQVNEAERSLSRCWFHTLLWWLIRRTVSVAGVIALGRTSTFLSRKMVINQKLSQNKSRTCQCEKNVKKQTQRPCLSLNTKHIFSQAKLTLLVLGDWPVLQVVPIDCAATATSKCSRGQC
jgi:hypothetical protein